MDGNKKFRSQALIVKTALRFITKTRRKTLYSNENISSENLSSSSASPSLSTDVERQDEKDQKRKSEDLTQPHREDLLPPSIHFDLSICVGIPDAPTNVRLMVTGSNNITVTYDEPHRSNGAMGIKYKSECNAFDSNPPLLLLDLLLTEVTKRRHLLLLFHLVEWSSEENFDESALQSDVVKNCFLREYVIRDLPVGRKCYVRVSAGNLKGFGPSTLANPPYCVPSSKDREKKREKTFLQAENQILHFRLERIFQNITSKYL